MTSGAHENYDVDGVYATLNGAVAGIKGRYSEPYRVTWEDIKGSDDQYVLVGHFEHVTGYSTEHTDTWYITRTELGA